MPKLPTVSGCSLALAAARHQRQERELVVQCLGVVVLVGRAVTESGGILSRSGDSLWVADTGTSSPVLLLPAPDCNSSGYTYELKK